METVICAIRFKELDSATASDIELLMNHNKIKDTAKRHAISMALSVGGREIGDHESDVIIEIPLAQANIIRDLHSRIQDELETSTTIGVGDTLKDAKLALDWAVDHRPGTIKVMEPAIGEMKADSDDDDKYDYFSPEEGVAIGQEDRPIPMYKAEDSQTVDAHADDSEAITPETKEKIAKIVQMLQENREYLSQLQQTNPDVYAGVVGVVQSISAMAQKAKKTDAHKHSKMITKIANHLDRAENKTLENETAAVLEMLIEAQQEKKDEEKFRRKALANKDKALKQIAMDRAEKPAKKHGLDQKFLAHLLK